MTWHILNSNCENDKHVMRGKGVVNYAGDGGLLMLEIKIEISWEGTNGCYKSCARKANKL